MRDNANAESVRKMLANAFSVETRGTWHQGCRKLRPWARIR